MIISASRRTDIPAFYSEWFFNRLAAGEAWVRNPMNPRQISRVPLNPSAVDAFVFWTKNPGPFLARLKDLAGYPYYFQFTINPYGPEAEPGLPDKMGVLVPTFQRLADTLGPHRVIWRYDPLLLGGRYTPAYHLEAFERLAKALAGYTRKCIFSFMDTYRKTARNTRGMGLIPWTADEMVNLAGNLAQLARTFSLRLETCAETIDLSSLGIAHGHCVDRALVEELRGWPLPLKADRNQRQACGCCQSVDIGAYHTCIHGCRYCYANWDTVSAQANYQRHNPDALLLLGQPEPADQIAWRR